MKPKKASSKAASEAVAVNRRRLLNNASPFAIKEAYVKLRTSLMFCMTADKERACKTFAITSSKPSEGKSLTAANVAISYAMLGKKVLLIDADMRKPTQRKLWKVELAAGEDLEAGDRKGAGSSALDRLHGDYPAESVGAAGFRPDEGLCERMRQSL